MIFYCIFFSVKLPVINKTAMRSLENTLYVCYTAVASLFHNTVALFRFDFNTAHRQNFISLFLSLSLAHLFSFSFSFSLLYDRE